MVKAFQFLLITGHWLLAACHNFGRLSVKYLLIFLRLALFLCFPIFPGLIFQNIRHWKENNL
jgi:hypothetical protein